MAASACERAMSGTAGEGGSGGTAASGEARPTDERRRAERAEYIYLYDWMYTGIIRTYPRPFCLILDSSASIAPAAVTTMNRSLRGTRRGARRSLHAVNESRH